MKRERAAAIAEQLERIATTLEQAEDVGRRKAGESLPGDLGKDGRLIDSFVRQWMKGAVEDAVRTIRSTAGLARPRIRRRP